MRQSETQWISRSHIGFRRWAIPWCTTHNAQGTPLQSCWVGNTPYTDAHKDCVISTGGPDHRWWVDAAE
jgi:hypothetical protein